MLVIFPFVGGEIRVGQIRGNFVEIIDTIILAKQKGFLKKFVAFGITSHHGQHQAIIDKIQKLFFAVGLGGMLLQGFVRLIQLTTFKLLVKGKVGLVIGSARRKRQEKEYE